MFRAPLCPSPGALEYYTSGCCQSYLVLCFQVVGAACKGKRQVFLSSEFLASIYDFKNEKKQQGVIGSIVALSVFYVLYYVPVLLLH
jgi:hypothetical protein